MERDINILDDIYEIVESCTGVGTLLDELTLLRTSLKAYCNGADPDEAVAYAARQLSDALTKRNENGRPNKKP